MVGPAYPRDKCLHELIEDQVERTPDAVAVLYEETELSYRELNQRANRLAHHLMGLGVGPETAVGLFLERSIELSVAVLALLKAGAASVPLDPDFPHERLTFMVEDTGAQLILTASRFADRLKRLSARVLCLDSEAETIAEESDKNPASGVVADTLCTYFYTSGSTGNPKAVMVTHRVGCRIQWANLNAVKLDERDRTLVTTSVSYGFFLGEFTSVLIRGGTAVLARPGGYQDIDYLVEEVNRRQITVVCFVPSVLRHFLTRLKEQGTRGGRSLRHIVSHGEALPAALEDELRTSLGAQLHKFFGMTEAPVVSYWNSADGRFDGRHVIGRPTDMAFYLLDAEMKPVPVGEVGEIYLGGPGLARGYLNRPGMTAERFLPNPFSLEPGSRIFRTGDYARWLPEGVIDFLGREDHLIKIRGLRVELGEIESVLCRQPAVHEAVVLVREDRPGEKRLVAYLVLREGCTTSSDALRTFLAQTLPNHMVPSALVMLEQMPRMAGSNKIDRRALPAPDPNAQGRTRAYVAPRDELEKRLVTLWESVLAIQPIGTGDDFFELGGDSLAAGQLFARIKDHFGVRLPPSTLALSATAGALAAILRSGATTADAGSESLTLLKQGGDGPALFLVHDGVGALLPYVDLVRRLSVDVTVHGIEPPGNERCPMLHTRISDMVSDYAARIRRAQPEGPYLLGGTCAGGLIAYAVALELEAQEQKVGFVALLDSVAPQAQMLPRLETGRSLARFKEMINERHGSLLGGIGTKAMRAVKKVAGFATYQVTSRARILHNAFRFRALRRAVDSGRRVPWYARGLPPMDVFWAAVQEYFPARTLKAPVMLYRASHGGDASDDEPRIDRYGDPLLGWGRWINEGLEIYPMPGGHASMLHPPHVDALAAHFDARLRSELFAGDQD
jgi:amino acid adenylation domain-containing protein